VTNFATEPAIASPLWTGAFNGVQQAEEHASEASEAGAWQASARLRA